MNDLQMILQQQHLILCYFIITMKKIWMKNSKIYLEKEKKIFQICYYYNNKIEKWRKITMILNIKHYKNLYSAHRIKFIIVSALHFILKTRIHTLKIKLRINYLQMMIL